MWELEFDYREQWLVAIYPQNEPICNQQLNLQRD